jgi:hypothetical protein
MLHQQVVVRIYLPTEILKKGLMEWAADIAFPVIAAFAMEIQVISALRLRHGARCRINFK